MFADFTREYFFSDTENPVSEQVNTVPQYSPATMLAAGKFKKFIKRPPKAATDGNGPAGNGVSASGSRRASRQGSQTSRHGDSREKLSRPPPQPAGRPDAASRQRHQRLNSLDMERTKSDSQRRRKGFGILAQTTDCGG